MSLDCIGNKTKYYVERNVSSANPTKIIIKARQPQQLSYTHNNLQHQHQQQDNLIENMSTSKIISRNNENKLHLPTTATTREPPPLAPISSILSNASCGLRKSNIINGSSITNCNSNNNNSSIVANKNNSSSTKIDISVGAFMLTKGLSESCGSPDGGNSNSSVSTNNSVYTNTTMDSGAASDNSSSITKFKFDFDELAPISTTTSSISSPSTKNASHLSLSTNTVSLTTKTTSTEQNHSNNDGSLDILRLGIMAIQIKKMGKLDYTLGEIFLHFNSYLVGIRTYEKA
ncbi:hypothetical protein ACFFRR_011097 [Megaselia abdita]